MDRGKDTKKMAGIEDPKVERSIRQKATVFINNPEKFRTWVQRSAMLQCLAFEHQARNEKDPATAKAAAEAFARLAEKLLRD